MARNYPNVTVSDHLLVKHFLTLMRPQNCSHNLYRQCLNNIYMCLTVDALRDFGLPSSTVDLVTPAKELARDQPFIHTEEMVLVAIMRGGMAPAAMLSNIFPQAPVAHFAMKGGTGKGKIEIDFERLPKKIGQKKCIVIAPRIETAGTLVAILNRLKELRKKRLMSDIIVINIVIAPEAAQKLLKKFPDVQIVTASIEDGLNDAGEVVPGIGHTGERVYGTQDLED